MMISRKRCHSEEKQEPSDDADENKAHIINTFSLEVLEKIFMYLPALDRMTMEKVCFLWKEACRLVWHNIKKYECSKSIRRTHNNRMLTQTDVQKILFKCGKYLNELSLSKVCNSSIMPFVSSHCKNLTKLEFEHNHSFENYIFSNFVYAFTRLDKLVYIKIKKIAPNFPIEVINSLPEGINEIHLFFEKFSHWNTEYIFVDFKKFKKLHSLTVNNCMLDNIIYDISEIITLVYLNLDDCSFERELWANKLINLEHLSVYRNHVMFNDSELINPQTLINILKSCKKLKYLKIIKLSKNRIATFLFEDWINLKNLEYLDCPWLITDESVINIVDHCQNLKYLRLDLMKTTINETSMIKLTKLKNLECLKLYNTEYFCRDKLIIAITNNCTKLKRLEIPGINVSLLSIFDGLSQMQNLEYLNLIYVCRLESSTIIAIANYCKNLKNLNIEFCTNITETALMALTNLKNLEILNVKWNYNVTDNFISKLKKLKCLNCGNCKKLTDVGVIQLMKNCPDLEHFIIGVNSNITIDTIIAADNITKNRINDIVLNLSISNNSLMTFSQSIIESRWLTLHKNDYKW